MRKREAKQKDESGSVSRRAFLYGLGGTAGLTVLADAGKAEIAETVEKSAQSKTFWRTNRRLRAERAYQIRVQAAQKQKQIPYPEQFGNGDESLYPNKIGTFTKGLVHNHKGEVNLPAYTVFKEALNNGNFEIMENVPMGNSKKLVNPLAGYSFSLEGRDSLQYTLAPAPSFSSQEIASELIELYWMSLCRDVHFDDYEQNELTGSAVAEISRLPYFKREDVGRTTPKTLFRGLRQEDPNSPYISQFTWKNIPLGANTLEQKLHVPVTGLDYLHTFNRWLDIQRGAPAGLNPLGAMTVYELDKTPRFIINGRDLGEFVHRDQTYIPFLHACLILLSTGSARDLGNPYRRSRTQMGFCTFGESHILDLLARVANAALRVCWYQKWGVHLYVRPETFSGRLHLVRNGKAEYPVSPVALNSKALEPIFRRTGTYLLPQAYPEGAPLHPSYPSGHSVIAGACATVLKAFFDEETYVRNPIVPSRDGSRLLPYKGGGLTIGGELNKLADNIGIGRMMAGIHWRSDHLGGLLLGEAVAIDLIRDSKDCFSETHAVFSLKKFDGTLISI